MIISQYLQEINSLHRRTISFFITVTAVCRKICFCTTLELAFCVPLKSLFKTKCDFNSIQFISSATPSDLWTAMSLCFRYVCNAYVCSECNVFIVSVVLLTAQNPQMHTCARYAMDIRIAFLSWDAFTSGATPADLLTVQVSWSSWSCCSLQDVALIFF